MEYLGKHYNFETYYLSIDEEDINMVLPKKNWYCCAIANSDFDDQVNSRIHNFIRTSIDRDILSWHGLGKYGQKLHLTFDLIMTQMEIEYNHSEIDVTTVGEENIDIADGFWNCYGASCLPERAEYETVKLICVSFDNHNYKEELKNLINKFNADWLPSDID
jgi:hypothetical protein